MRTVIELRRPLGSIPIEDIKPDAKSRDDTPALLIGLQAVYKDEALRNKLFALLDKHILPDRRRDTGRPGMELWSILAVGVLKQGLRCDCDRLQDQADGHIKIRQMLGHGNPDESECEIQNIRDNEELMTPELLREVSRLIARADAKLSKKKAWRGVGRALRLVRGGDGGPPSDRLQPSAGFDPLPASGDGAGLRRRRARTAQAAFSRLLHSAARPARAR